MKRKSKQSPDIKVLAYARLYLSRGFSVIPVIKGTKKPALGDLLLEPEEDVSWVVEGLLPSGGFSILEAKPKVGKSTLARDLCLSIAGGKPFLGRDVAQGPVIYLALEEKRGEVRRHFKDMGAKGDEPIFIYSGRVPSDAIEQVTDAVRKIKPVLVIIDPLFRFTKVRDTSAYAEITAALEPLLLLSRETGTHVLCIHHISKGNGAGWRLPSWLNSDIRQCRYPYPP